MGKQYTEVDIVELIDQLLDHSEAEELGFQIAGLDIGEVSVKTSSQEFILVVNEVKQDRGPI